MAGLGKSPRMVHGFGVAYLADQNDIRRLAQSVLQRMMPGMSVDADFAMRDQRLMRLMHEFDRILHGDDMAGHRAVAMIDHGGQRRRLARTGGAHDQHQAPGGHDDFLEDFRQCQRGEIRYFRRNGSDHHAYMLLLNEDVDAKPRHTRNRNGETALQFLGDPLALATS